MRIGTGMAAAGAMVVAGLLVIGQTTAAPPPNQKALDAERSTERLEVDASWWGFDPVDATKALQAAIDSNAKLVRVPNMGSPWIVGPITLISDQTIEFEEGVVILAKEGLFKGSNDCLFNAEDKDNITLTGYGAHLVMRRDDYIDPTRYRKSEWRHGISLRSCNNVSILGLSIEDTGGDGIHVGRVHPYKNTHRRTYQPYSRNIVIRDVVLDRNHRQGISIVSAENVLIENAVIKNTFGADPAVGLSLEPGYADERMVNVRIRNAEFSDNPRAMMLLLKALTDQSPAVSVLFENCRVLTGAVAIDVAGLPDKGASGTIRFKDCVIDAGVTRIRDKSADAAALTFANCVFQNPAGPPLTMYASYGSTDRLGGVAFEDCRVVETAGAPVFQVVKHQDTTLLVGVSGSLTVLSPQARAVEVAIPAENVSLRIDGRPLVAGARGTRR